MRANMTQAETILAKLPAPTPVAPDRVIQGTGIQAGPEVIEQAKARMREVQAAPVAFVMGVWLHEEARESFGLWVDDQAQRHGLPPAGLMPDGQIDHYGLSTEGEFTRMVAASV